MGAGCSSPSGKDPFPRAEVSRLRHCAPGVSGTEGQSLTTFDGYYDRELVIYPVLSGSYSSGCIFQCFILLNSEIWHFGWRGLIFLSRVACLFWKVPFVIKEGGRYWIHFTLSHGRKSCPPPSLPQAQVVLAHLPRSQAWSQAPTPRPHRPHQVLREPLLTGGGMPGAGAVAGSHCCGHTFLGSVMGRSQAQLSTP